MEIVATHLDSQHHRPGGGVTTYTYDNNPGGHDTWRTRVDYPNNI